MVVYFFSSSAVKGGSNDVIGFSNPANGVTVSRLSFSASGGDANLLAFRLKMDKDGCNDIKGNLKKNGLVYFCQYIQVCRNKKNNLCG